MTRKRPVPPGVQVERVSTLSLQVTVTSLSTAERSFIAVSQVPAVMAYRIFQRRIIDINAAFEQEAGLMMQELLDNGLIAPR